MNPIHLGVLSVCFLLSANQAEAASHKTIRAHHTPQVIKQASGDALSGAQQVIERRREYPHYLFTDGAAPPAPTPIRELLDTQSLAQGQTVMRIALIRVEFETNSVGDQFTGTGRFNLFPDASIPVDPPPRNKAFFQAHGEALSRYYLAQSYDQFKIEVTVFPPESDSAYRLADPANYGPWDIGQDTTIVNKAERFVTDGLLAADEAGDIDFSEFDGVILAHAGADFQGDVDFNSPYDIPSFTLTYGIPLETSTGIVPRVTVVPETTSQDGLWGALNGVMAHEVGHLLGLPDLYNIFNGSPQVGWFSVMDSGENLIVVVADSLGNPLYEARGTTPTSLDPWSKLQAFPGVAKKLFVGSSSAPFVNGVWSADLNASILDPNIPTLFASEDEYFLLENRVLDLDGNLTSFADTDSATGVILGPAADEDLTDMRGALEYDWPIPAEAGEIGGGIAIWHIDDALIRRGLANFGEINLAIAYRGVALEEADGIWDIGYNTGFPFGHPRDLFYLGNNTLFDPLTTPSSETNRGAYSGITVQIEDPQGEPMAVRVRNPLLRPDWPLSISPDFELGHMAISTAGGEPEMIVTFSNTEAEDYGVVNTDVSFGASHDQPLPNPILTVDDFNYPAQAPDRLTAAIDAKGQLVAWDKDGEELFTTGRGLRTTPVVASWSGDGEAQDVLLVVSDTAVEAVDGAGETVRQWEFEAHDRTSNIVVFPDGSFAVAFTGELCRFSLNHTTPLACQSLPEPISRLVAGDTGEGTGRVFAQGTSRMFVIAESTWQEHTRWELPADFSPTTLLGDVDDDGVLEVAMADTSGGLWVVNEDGSSLLGWPYQSESRWTSIRTCDVDGDETVEVVAADRTGHLYAFTANGEVAPTFPRPFSDGAGTPISLVAHEGDLLAFGVTPRKFWSWYMPGSSAPQGSWLTDMSGPRRHGYVQAPSAGFGGPDIGTNAFLAYPNPTLGSNVEIRFLLEPEEDFEIVIIDAAGQQLNADLDLRLSPQPGENAVEWRVDDVAPGLYYCLLKRTGTKGSRLDRLKVAVLH